MLLKRLKLINFLIYDEVDVDLSDIRLASIIGQFVNDRRRSNGSGKTAFLESIRYALYDQTRSKKKAGILKTGKKSSTVELSFEVEGNSYRVSRSINDQGLSQATLYLNEKLISAKVRDVNDAVVQVIGLDAELFDQIYFFKQNDHFGFAEAAPTDRKNALGKVFRMDRLAKCEEIAKKQRSAKDAKAIAAKAALDLLGSELNSLGKYQSLVDEEIAITGNLANAQQLAAFYTAFEADNDDSASALREQHSLFTIDIQASVEGYDIAVANRDAQKRSLERAEISEKSAQERLASARADLEKTQKVEPIADFEKKRSALQNSLKDLQSSVAIPDNRLFYLNEQLKNLGSQGIAFKVGDKCPTCGQQVAADHLDHVAHDRLKKIGEYESQIPALIEQKKIADERYQQVRKEFDDLDAAHHQSKIYALKLDAYKQAENALAGLPSTVEAKQNYLNLCAQVQEYEKKIDKNLVERYTNGVNAKVAAARKIFNSKHRSEAVKNEIVRLTGEQMKARLGITRHNELSAKCAVKSAELNQALREKMVYDYLSEAFGKNGIQALVVENAIGLIESFANDILKQMQTRFSLSVRTTKETKTGDVRESLDIFVFDNGQEKQFENYSGGEKALINFAIRLSLSKVISSLHGVRMQSLFLDEVLGALDAPNREEVVKILSYLSREYQQVFVVSHTEEVQDVIDSSIVIERSPTNSTVRIKNG